MKFDMHCHTREGSLDAKAGLRAVANHLKQKGFSGMLVTDHNSYRGYHKFQEIKKEIKDFVVLKGIEYDTRDAGHMLVVLPDHVQCKLLELRGMTVDRLEKVVHDLGGILGPAHPYGTGFFALMNNWRIKKSKEIIHKFDFIETFNSCNKPEANQKAERLATNYGKLQFAGSDAHHTRNLGTAFTEFKAKITCNNDLIKAVKNKEQTTAGGDGETVYYKKEHLLLKWMGIIGYWIYNKTGAVLYGYARIMESRKYHYAVEETGGEDIYIENRMDEEK